jgi:hypothetical protein
MKRHDVHLGSNTSGGFNRCVSSLVLTYQKQVSKEGPFRYSKRAAVDQAVLDRDGQVDH